MKRWLGLFAVLMLAGVVAWFVARQMEPLESRFERVEIGMSRAEVEAIMGKGLEPPTALTRMSETSDASYRCWVEPDTTWMIPRHEPARSYWVRFEDNRLHRKWVEGARFVDWLDREDRP